MAAKKTKKMPTLVESRVAASEAKMMALAPPHALPRDEHAEHLAMLEKLLGEVASLRTTIAQGFDTLVAAVLDAAVEEAAEPVKAGRDPEPEDYPPDPPAEDASKASLTPSHKVATFDDVRDALNAYTRKTSLFEAAKVVQGLGVKRLTELPPERYAEAVEALS